MVQNYFNEIIATFHSPVYVRNADAFNNKVDDLIKGGFKNLYVVSDFDRTITKRYHNGKKHVTSFGMIAHCNSVPEKYVDDEAELNRKYIPLENSTSITHQEKVKYMEEWWQKTEDILKGLTVSPSEIEETVKRIGSSLRNGTPEMFSLLNRANVPTLVFSAGLGDIVESILKAHGILFPNVKVVSNFLQYNEEGEVLGFQRSPIQIYNKNETVLKDFNYEQFVQGRHNVILMGDSLGDATMSEGRDDKGGIVLKIGFLDHSVEKYLEQYMEVFDLVIVDDDSMNVPNTILKFIFFFGKNK